MVYPLPRWAAPGTSRAPERTLFTSPLISKREPWQRLDRGYKCGCRAGSVGRAVLGLRALSQPQLASSPSDSTLSATEEKPEEAKNENRKVPRVSPRHRRNFAVHYMHDYVCIILEGFPDTAMLQ